MDMIQIIIDLGYKPGRELVGLKLDRSTTVAMVKQWVQERDGVPPEAQRLLFKGCQLEDDLTLSDCNVEDMGRLLVVLRLRGNVSLIIQKPSHCVACHMIKFVRLDRGICWRIMLETSPLRPDRRTYQLPRLSRSSLMTTSVGSLLLRRPTS